MAIGEIVLVKIFHPGLGVFMSQEEFDKSLRNRNIEKEIDEAVAELPRILEERYAKKVKKPLGSRSHFAGKILTSKVAKNPRMEGTLAGDSFKIILDNPGIVFEKFRELGGRPGDLKHDVDQNWVEVK